MAHPRTNGPTTAQAPGRLQGGRPGTGYLAESAGAARSILRSRTTIVSTTADTGRPAQSGTGSRSSQRLPARYIAMQSHATAVRPVSTSATLGSVSAGGSPPPPRRSAPSPAPDVTPRGPGGSD